MGNGRQKVDHAQPHYGAEKRAEMVKGKTRMRKREEAQKRKSVETFRV